MTAPSMRQTRPASEAGKPKGKVATLGRFVPGIDAQIGRA
ncbi:MAG: hypothetical protein QG587_2039, partial [Chloroflexota bacterium]|nr:hypothetical protein [Chloroflexota bacterium]